MEKENGGVVEVPSQIVTRVTIQMIVSVAMANLLGRVATSTRANTKMTKEMGTARCIGQMAVVTKAIGYKESSMGTAE